MESVREGEVASLLQKIGCKMKKPAFGAGWVIIEPLGGRVSVGCLREAEDYYWLHQQSSSTSAD
ncbi:hypothetical protein A9Q81_19170 [Gammaproteobacteria bacterium 42_54_T18]|nr:hypothetical protein A9Q81_19170 [Gammaproteobacteria bacterium 42_54_T18]